LLGFTIEDEYTLTYNARLELRNNRSIKGMLGLSNLSDNSDWYYYSDYYSVGKKTFLYTSYGNLHVYDGREVVELEYD